MWSSAIQRHRRLRLLLHAGSLLAGLSPRASQHAPRSRPPLFLEFEHLRGCRRRGATLGVEDSYDMTSNPTELQGFFDPVAAERVAVEARLDAALAATFPASDPVAITVSRLRHERVGDRLLKQGEPSWTD